MNKPLSKKSKIGIVGAGVLGKVLAAVLSENDYLVAAVSSRSLSSSEELAHLVVNVKVCADPNEVSSLSDVVFVTTPDDLIKQVVSSVDWKKTHTVIHCSGALSLDVLSSASTKGARVGAFHPMQAFAAVENGIKSIAGTTFGIEGDEVIQQYLADTARAIGGYPIFLKAEDKVLYHLSGVMLGGILSGVGATAAQLWEHLGMERTDGLRALMPIMRQVSINLSSQGIPEGIAGPYARGDVGTIRKHLQVLAARAPDVLPLYCNMALSSLPFALEKGTLTEERASEIYNLLEESLGRTR